MVQYPPGYDEWNYSHDLDSTDVRIFSACFALIPLTLLIAGAKKLLIIRRIHGGGGKVAGGTAGKVPSTGPKSRQFSSKHAEGGEGSVSGAPWGGGKDSSAAVAPMPAVSPPTRGTSSLIVGNKYAPAPAADGPGPAASTTIASQSSPSGGGGGAGSGSLLSNSGQSSSSSVFSCAIPPWVRHKSVPVASVAFLSGLFGLAWCLNGLIRGAGANMNRDALAVVLATSWVMLLGYGRVKVQHNLLKLAVEMMRTSGTNSSASRGKLNPQQRAAELTRFSRFLHAALLINAFMYPLTAAVLIGCLVSPRHTRALCSTMSVGVFILSISGPGSSYIMLTRILRTLEEHASALAETNAKKHATNAAAAAAAAAAGPGTNAQQHHRTVSSGPVVVHVRSVSDAVSVGGGAGAAHSRVTSTSSGANTLHAPRAASPTNGNSSPGCATPIPPGDAWPVASSTLQLPSPSDANARGSFNVSSSSSSGGGGGSWTVSIKPVSSSPAPAPPSLADAHLAQMALWQSKLSALKKSFVPIVLTVCVGIVTLIVPWMSAHLTYLVPMCIVATNLGMYVATKQLPVD